MKVLRHILVLTLFLAGFQGRAASDAFPDKPSPERLVNDFASAFSHAELGYLEATLVAFDDSTSNQICVVTVPDLSGYDVAEYALRVGNKWGVGSSRNNGVLILLKPRGTDRYVDVTIQVGRGLEGAITDVAASRIIRNVMGPSLREDRYFDAIKDGCREIMALASGEISEKRAGEEEGTEDIIFILVVVFIIVLFILSARSGKGGNGGSSHTGSSEGPTIYFGPGPFGGGFGGGGGGGFGGFGGGSFGGGGASGRF